jgi:hypothetical protein
LTTTTTASGVLVGPTAAASSITGRVLTSAGRPISKARITITDQNGESKTVQTNPFGFYRIEDVKAGETYVFSVEAKWFQTATAVKTISEDVTDFDIVLFE